MTLNQILRRIRRQPAEPQWPPELTPELRAIAEQWHKDLAGLSREDIDEIERRSIEGREDAIRAALAESDAYFSRHREERRHQSR